MTKPLSRREKALKAIQSAKAKKMRGAASLQKKNELEQKKTTSKDKPETKQVTSKSTDVAVVSPVEPVKALSHVDDAVVIDVGAGEENIPSQDEQNNPVASTETLDQNQLEEEPPSGKNEGSGDSPSEKEVTGDLEKSLEETSSKVDDEEEKHHPTVTDESELEDTTNLDNDEQFGDEADNKEFSSEFEEWTDLVKNEFVNMEPSDKKLAVNSTPDPTEPVVGANGYQINTVEKEKATTEEISKRDQKISTPVEGSRVEESEKLGGESKGTAEQERKDSKHKRSKYKHIRSDRRLKKTRSSSRRNSGADDDSESAISQNDSFFDVKKPDVGTQMLDTVLDLFAMGDDMRSLDEETIFSERTDDSERSAPFFSALIDAVKSKNGMLKDMEEMFMERMGCGVPEGHGLDAVYEDRSMTSSFDTRDIQSYDGTENSYRWKNKKPDTRSRVKNRVYSNQKKSSNSSLRSASSTVQSSSKDGETTISKQTEQSGTTLDADNDIYKADSEDTRSVRMEADDETNDNEITTPESTTEASKLDHTNSKIYAQSGSFYSLEEKKEESGADAVLTSLEDAFAKLDVAADQRGSDSQVGSKEVVLDRSEETGDLAKSEVLEDVGTNYVLNESIEQSLNQLSVHTEEEEEDGAPSLKDKLDSNEQVNGGAEESLLSTEAKTNSSSKPRNETPKKKGRLRKFFKPLFRRSKSKTGSQSKKEDSQPIVPKDSLAPKYSPVEESSAVDKSFESSGTASTKLSSQKGSPSRQAPFGSPKGPLTAPKVKRETLLSKDSKPDDTHGFDTIMSTGAQTDDWNTIINKVSTNSNNESPMQDTTDVEEDFGDFENKAITDRVTVTNLPDTTAEAQELNERSGSMYSAASGSWGSPDTEWFSPLDEIQEDGAQQLEEEC